MNWSELTYFQQPKPEMFWVEELNMNLVKVGLSLNLGQRGQVMCNPHYDDTYTGFHMWCVNIYRDIFVNASPVIAYNKLGP